MADDISDDLTIEDADGLLRRVPNSPTMFKFDDNLKIYRPTSACFSDKDGGVALSVTLERPLLEGGGAHQDAILVDQNFGLARLEAGFVRHNVSPPQKIIRAPVDEDEHHALVVGEKSKAAKKAMAKAAKLVIQPKKRHS